MLCRGYRPKVRDSPKRTGVLPFFERAGQRHAPLKRVAQTPECRLLFLVGVKHVFTFFGLLSAFCPPNGQMPPGTHTAAHSLAELLHCSLCCAQWRRQHCWQQHAVPLMLAHLDKTQWGTSPPPPRLTVATATPLRRPPHALQVHRGSSAPLLFMRACRQAP